jgi:hypothetical protein
MKKPLFTALKSNHYSSNELSPSYADKKSVYSEIGYDIDNLIKQNPGYENTCATRMSLALIKSGVAFSGRLKIKAGPHKGRSFEPGAKLLADQLAQKHVLGKPQIFKPTEAISKLNGKKGIIFFWKISGYDGGHIDLIETTNSAQVCNSACYFSSKEIWFWPLE